MSVTAALPKAATCLLLAALALPAGSGAAEAQSATPVPTGQASQQSKPKSPGPAKPDGNGPSAKPAADAHGKPKPGADPQGKSAHGHAGKAPAADKHKKAAVVPVAPAVPPPAPAPAATEARKPEPPKGSGLPLPRFAALRSDEVNMRAGPGTRYPIDWVYKRRDLPVEIEREFEVWRLIRDPEGTKGWVHQATLTGRRTLMVTGETRILRKAADAGSAELAELKPGVIGRIRSCEAESDWCQVQVGDYRGFLKRSEIWGLLPGEAVTN